MRLPSCSRICSQGSAKLVLNDVDRLQEDQKLKMGIAFDWALGDRWIQCDPRNFGRGTTKIMKHKYIELLLDTSN
ncbi:hypothetical protein Patl1_24255 [Pistacia atlantica]|nr:hypothetical protein Patl1_24255 [Pistacia atlantica]